MSDLKMGADMVCRAVFCRIRFRGCPPLGFVMIKAFLLMRTGAFRGTVMICMMTALYGCRHSAPDPVMINRVVFYNASGRALKKIDLINPQKSRLAGCSHLDCGAISEVGFSPRPYTEDAPAVLRWQRNGQVYRQSMPPFRFAPGVSGSDSPAAVVIEFRPDGTVDSALK